MCSYRTVYRFIKQILFFSYFLSLNIYSSPIFILCQCCQQICNLVTYFLGVCIGGGIVGMDIWSRIFVEELRTIFKVCVCLDKRRGGQLNVHRCGQGGGGSSQLWITTRRPSLNRVNGSSGLLINSFLKENLHVSYVLKTFEKINLSCPGWNGQICTKERPN